MKSAFGPATEGTTRGMRFVLPGSAATEAVFTKRLVEITPLAGGGPTVMPLPANPTVPVGYLNLRSFISTAEEPLRAAYAAFRAQGIEYFIFDLRYNSGGLVSVAELIGDLNGAARDDADVYLEMRFNDRKAPGNDVVRRFQPRAESVAPVRIAFITTGLTASASEIVINSLALDEVAIVGDDTLGKPVGQSAFDLSGCDLRLRLISFQFTNADGQGGYYDGLASTLPFACRADDVTSARRLAMPQRASTAEALSWLGSGVCTEVLTAAGGSLPKGQARLRVPGSGGLRPPRCTCPASIDGLVLGFYRDLATAPGLNQNVPTRTRPLTAKWLLLPPPTEDSPWPSGRTSSQRIRPSPKGPPQVRHP